MFVPKRRPEDGTIDLSDPQTQLHFVNRAHRVLLVHCDRNGWLSVSSSKGILRRSLEELTDAQVTEINNILFTLGLRESKPGGGDHVINIGIYAITLEQLLANKRLPAAGFANSAQNYIANSTQNHINEELMAAIDLTIEQFNAVAERVDGSTFGAAIVRNHMRIIEDVAGEFACDVICALKRLDLYRVYAFGQNYLCFVQPDKAAYLTPNRVALGRALVEWPDTIEELLPPNYSVGKMPPEQIIAALVKECEKLDELYLNERRARVQAEQALTMLKKELADVASAYERLERTAAEGGVARRALVQQIADLKAEVATLNTRPTAAEIPEDLRSRVDRILGQRRGEL